MKNALLFALLAFSVFSISCADDEENPPSNTATTTPTSSSTNTTTPTTTAGTSVQTSNTSNTTEPSDAGDDVDEPDADLPDVTPDTSPDDVDEPDSPDAPDEDVSDPPKDCIQVSVSPDWSLEYSDDISIEYDSVLQPTVNNQYALLSILFERYSPGADIGTFELGGDGPDSNFGNCAHCVYMRGLTPERAFFADRGTLITRDDPYARVLDMTLTNLRLVEVDVNLETRESTPVADGLCVEIAPIEVRTVYAPPAWTCPPEQYRDGRECQCECGDVDPDCNTVTECPPFDPDCVTSDPLPVVDCAADQICGFDPVAFSSACIDTCIWEESADACGEGVCVYPQAYEENALCVESQERIDRASIGERCGSSIYQLYCNIEDGFAQGYCGPNNVCRSICDEESDCTDPDHTCRFFLNEDGLGYCGPEPEDG